MYSKEKRNNPTKKMLQFFIVCISLMKCAMTNALPSGFVYIEQIDPSIQQDIRYATSNNIMGRPLHGYIKPRCILAEKTAMALKKVQQQLNKKQLSLKVYDCYRPQMAVEDLWQWSQQNNHDLINPNYYPRVKKSELFAEEYIARYSGHTRGSTVDLTIVPMNSDPATSHILAKHIACYADYALRQNDNSLDMGTNFDCLDPLSYADNQQIPAQAQKNRRLLRQTMQKYGFLPYRFEWWHFTLKNEPYPQQYFNFPVQ